MPRRSKTQCVPAPKRLIDQAEIERRFLYHAPNEMTRALHDEVRALGLEFAGEMNSLLGDESREKSLFFTALEEASFWAHAHIARNIGVEETPDG